MQSTVSISDELAPALSFAHQYFGEILPEDLIHKLRNKTQTLDTLFELNCLGLFQLCHAVSYEPKLKDGKVPDMMVSLPDIGDIFIECKSQGLNESEYQRVFQKFGTLCLEAVSNTQAQAAAWERGFRTEVRVAATPHLNEIEHVRDLMSSIQVDDLIQGMSVGLNITVIAVPREDAYIDGPSTRMGQIQVGPVSTKVSSENMHAVVYSWPGIDLKRRRSQRQLLSEARRKLKAIPKNSYGAICLQTYAARQFSPDVHQALVRPEFSQIPCVWLNPLHESELISRSDGVRISEAIFKPMQEEMQRLKQQHH